MVIINEERIPNLLSYKYFIRKQASKLYGKHPQSKSKHQQNVHNLLKILALNGPLTTWEMAKIKFPTNNEMVRTKEKEYRRLLIGRTDRRRHSEGILDLNLVLIDSKSTKRNPGNRYRLSLFGILFCLDSLDLSHEEIDRMAEKYQILLPKIFGRWDFLKNIIGVNIYNLKLLGKGLLFDNPNIIDVDNAEFWELISYFNIKSNNLSYSLNEKIMGNLISYWFFITLLYLPALQSDKKIKNSKKMLSVIFHNDTILQKWFDEFILEAQIFYKERSKVLKGISMEIR
ncbi:MAG: hypothetical protein K5777_01085 [Nitrosopumilus sp.]|nr:hypothetical protein [Nitrosopumilus sp.]